MQTRQRRFVLIAITLAWCAVLPCAVRAQASAPGNKLADEFAALRALAVDAQRLARNGDFAEARARVEKMEAQWRLSQSNVKTVSPEKWKTVDAALDRVERELRFWRARRTDSAEALQALIDIIDSPT